MAYIIPSRNIYSIKNPKVIKNAVKTISTKQQKIDRDDADRVEVYSYSDWDYEGHLIPQISKNEKNDKPLFVGPNANPQWGSFIGYFGYIFVDKQKVHNVTVKIPIVRESSFIEKLYLGTDIEGEGDFAQEIDNISTYFIGTKTSGLANVTWDAEVIDDPNSEYYFRVNIDEGLINYKERSEQDRETYSIPKKLEISHDVVYPVGTNPTTKKITNKLDVINVGNIPTVKASHIKTETEEYYQLDLSVFCSFRQTSLAGGFVDNNTTPNRSVAMYGQFIMNGEWEQYEVTELQVSIYGKTIGIALTEEEYTIGDNKNPITIRSNELLQKTTKTSNAPTVEYLANNVLTQYANGKETATIQCVVGEYYNDAGTLVVSTKSNELPMTFNIGDIVIPMVYGADGKDYPMSRKKDGSAKQFRVVGKKVYFDGAILQELTLQEY